jgi:tubulin polyglutamylase TTLL2
MEADAFAGFDDDAGIAVGGWDDADLDAQLAALDKRDAALNGGDSPVNWKEAIEAEDDTGGGGLAEFPAARPASGARERGLNSAHGRRPVAQRPAATPPSSASASAAPTAARTEQPERRSSARGSERNDSRGAGSRAGSSQSSSRSSSSRGTSRGEAKREAARSGRARRDRGRSTGAAGDALSAARAGRPPRREARQAASASAASATGGEQQLLFRMGATGQGAVVLRKVLGEATNWAEVEETEEAHDGGLARSAGLKLPSLTDGRGRCQAPVERPDWNLTWRTGRFAPSEYANCNGSCRVNHIPKSSAICKKDNLVRHVRKARGVFGPIYNFLPTSFLVPTEYTKFAEHFSDLAERGEKSTWICKPTGMSRGRKIFLLDDISGLAYDRACVVQRYIPRPLLIGGYKMDIRLYVAVTSARPLRAFVYQEGLTRFSTEKYDMSDLSNVFSHLTNYSINKDSNSYETEKDVIGGGAKWLFSRLLRYLEDHGHDTKLLWTRIRHICILTVLILMPLVPAEASGCFELFGFDILVDEQLHPWLLEVNAAPALAAGSDVDWAVKEPLLRDLIGLLDFNDPGTHDALDRKQKKQRQGAGRGRRGSSTGSGAQRPNSRRQRSANGGGGGSRGRSRSQTGGASASDSGEQEQQQPAAAAAAAAAAAGFPRFGGYEMLFPFNEKMANLSEQCSEGLGGKVIAEHGKVVRQIVEEVKRVEEAAAADAAGGGGGGGGGGDESATASGGGGGGGGGGGRRLLARDIDTDPSLPGRKDHQGARQRRMAAMAGSGAGGYSSSSSSQRHGGAGLDDLDGGLDSMMPMSSASSAKPSAGGSGRFDLAASLADTDAAIAALMAPSITG